MGHTEIRFFLRVSTTQSSSKAFFSWKLLRGKQFGKDSLEFFIVNYDLPKVYFAIAVGHFGVIAAL